MAGQTLSKGASEVLELDIRSIELELSQTDTQIKQMEARREALTYKRDLLRKAVGHVDLIGSTGTPATTSAINGASHSEESPFVATGFRASIRMVLKDNAKGMRPREVYNELAKRGIAYSGKTDPVIRTSTEMWRMEKTGQVRKSRGLYFAQEITQ